MLCDLTIGVDRMNRLLASPLMVFVYIFSAIAGVFVGLTIGGATSGVALAIVLSFGFVLAIAAVEIVFRRKIAGDIEMEQDFVPIQDAVIVGGKVIKNVDELPDEVKKIYQHFLDDADADGIPDILQGITAKEDAAEAFKADQVRQLQESKQMLDSGLITREEYEVTVKQILAGE